MILLFNPLVSVIGLLCRSGLVSSESLLLVSTRLRLYMKKCDNPIISTTQTRKKKRGRKEDESDKSLSFVSQGGLREERGEILTRLLILQLASRSRNA